MLPRFCNQLTRQICSGSLGVEKINSQHRLFCLAGSRNAHTDAQTAEKQKISKHPDRLELTHECQTIPLYYIWLRDHCRCSSCWNSKTYQKNVKFQEIDVNIKPNESYIEENNLKITWPDGHQSSYPLTWLVENSYPNSMTSKLPRTLWDSDLFKSPQFERFKYKDFLNDADVLKIMLKNLYKYGFAFVDEVPADIDHTQKVSERVCHIHETLFGRMWSFTADGARADTAYTNIPLGAHTDGTFYENTAGIQVFHCLFHDGEGGETLLEDGFYCAEKLRQTDPEAFEMLATTPIHHEFIEPELGFLIKSLATIIKLHPITKELEQFRYNIHDRTTVNTISSDKIMKFYGAARLLAGIVEDDKHVHFEKLRPGTVLFVDNWRVMHGRKGFTGKRVVCGNYLSRDDWLSRARVVGLI